MLVDPDRLIGLLGIDLMSVPESEVVAVCAAVDSLLLPRLSALVDPGDPPAAVVEAALGIAVQVWQARWSPGGQMLGGELGGFAPHLLGPGLVARFGGLLAPYLRHGGAVIC